LIHQDIGSLIIRFFSIPLCRWRRISLPLPGSAMRQGGNVLAIEVHRSPANAVMFTAEPLILSATHATFGGEMRSSYF
jgi:hypothetical protein